MGRYPGRLLTRGYFFSDSRVASRSASAFNFASMASRTVFEGKHVAALEGFFRLGRGSEKGTDSYVHAEVLGVREGFLLGT